MKRRAQPVAAPAVEKRKKLTKDEPGHDQLYSAGAPTAGDRAPKPRATTSAAPIAAKPSAPKATTSSSPRNVADNIARRPRDDPSVVPVARSPQTSLPLTSLPSLYSMSPSQPMASKSSLMAIDLTSSSASPSRLPLAIAPLVVAPLTLNSPICWARVNRMSWWPGKVCTLVWTPGGADFPVCHFEGRSSSYFASCSPSSS